MLLLLSYFVHEPCKTQKNEEEEEGGNEGHDATSFVTLRG